MIVARFPRLFSLLLALAVLPAALRADYKGVVVMDAASGAILREENGDAVSPPASVAKLMTFLVVHDALAAGRIQLTTPITATAADQSMGGTQVNLAAGETFPVEELLYAVMIESANDAAHALVQIAGGRDAFVGLMNARAQSLGMKNTVFRTPHGLPAASRKDADGDLTTPHDLALLARELVTHTDVLRYSSVKVRPFGAGVRPTPLGMRNHNKLLTTVEGCDGLKTGYTKTAGYCLVATAQRGGKRVIVAITGSSTAKVRDEHVKTFIEEGFAKIPADSVFTGGAITAVSPVETASPVTPVAPAAPGGEAPAVRFELPKRR